METGDRNTAGADATVLDEQGGSGMSWLTVDDESASELSKLLGLFEAPPPPIKARFVVDPYSSLVLFHSTSYITINVNEESCGSSFSVSDDSVMASLDAGGARCAWWNAEGDGDRCVGVGEEIWGSYGEGSVD